MQKILAFFRLIRWFNLLIAGASLLLFHFFIVVPSLGALTPTLHWWQAVLLAVSVMCIMAAGNAINDFFDYAQDKKFKPQKQVLGKEISLDEVPYIIGTLNVVGIGLAAWLAYSVGNLKLVNVFLLSALLLWQYSSTLKKYALIGNAIVAGLCAIVFVLPVLFETQLTGSFMLPASKYYILTQMQGYAVFAFMVTLAREIVKDIEDAEADKAYNFTTLPVWLGVRVSAVVAGLLEVLLMAAVAFVMYVYWNNGLKNHFWYAVLFIQFPILVNVIPLFVAYNKTDFRVQSVMLKLTMVFGLVSIPLFYWFNK
ncbi:MAG: geranylgeranylglycerol-phosphate geranylgeranyltransferase [Chitinophagales bacterium]